MKLSYFALVVLLIINSNQINGQNEVLSCSYGQTYYGYQCSLTIKNLNGLNSFQDIKGSHTAGKSDSDVTKVVFASGSSTLNIPSIICEKFENLKDFAIYTAGLKEIHDYSFASCKNLQTLDILVNNISKVHENAFNKNLKLDSLKLCESAITTFPANTFPGSGNRLTLLELSRNKIKVLKPEWFKNLENLKTLYLERNEIEALPINIFNPLKNLEFISMRSNKLKSLSAKSFGDLSKLIFLDFGNNLISAIDKEFVKYESFSFNNNLCAPINECTDNFRALENGCTIGKVNGRICKLESEIQDCTETAEAIKKLQKSDAAKGKKMKDLESKLDVIFIAIKSLQSQVNMLSTRS